MSAKHATSRTNGIVLVGTHPWTKTAFDTLVPRPLLPIAHRPLLSYALSWLRDGNIRDVSVCANRETQALESRLHRHVPAGMTVSYQEDAMPRGAAGAFRDAAVASGGNVFVIVDGTAIPNVDLSELLQTHRDSGAAATVVVHAESEREGTAPVQVPSGIYVINREVLDLIPATGFYDLKENLIPQLYKTGERVSAFVIPTASPRVLDASTYLAVNEWMVEHLVAAGEPLEGYVKNGTSLIHRDAQVDPGAMLVGPVLVGPGAWIKAGAVIVGPTSIGREATVEAHALVSRSAIWRRCHVGETAAADRCIIGDDAIVPAGTQSFRQIRMASGHADMERAQPAPRSQEVASLDLLKRMSRALLGTTWSRSPAAQ
jgi:NDP-sugar pyrophosphorylase family protein